MEARSSGRATAPGPSSARAATAWLGAWQGSLATRASVALLVVAFIGLAMGYALATPPWNNPDEPAHYNYVRYVATTASLPELRPGDWDAARLEFLKAARFPPSESIDALRYEAHQPPLYYLLAAPVLLVAELFGQQASVLALRAVSIALGAALVVATFGLARGILSATEAAAAPSPATWLQRWPLGASHRPTALALLAAGVAAFIPMHTAMSAAINNDALANLLSAIMLALLWRGLERGYGRRGAAVVGLVAGAMLLTKLTTYGLVALAAATVGLVELRRAGGVRQAAAWATAGRALGAMLAAALLASGWWLLRQGVVYGFDDLLASRRHELVVAGQPRWADLPLDPLPHFATTLFRSFWAQFGWMGVLVDERLYRMFGLFTSLAVFGLGLRAGLRMPGFGGSGRREAGARGAEAQAGAGMGETGVPVSRLLLVVATVGVVAAEVLYYNLTYVQPQGRYLFPALAPIALLLALGWESLLARGLLGRGLAAGWVAGAGLEGAGLLLGFELSPRVVTGAAVVVGGGLALAERRGSLAPAGLGGALLLAPVPVLGLLNLVCLVRFVGPAFAR